MSRRGELGVAVAAVICGGSLAVLGAGRAWVRGSAAAGPGLPLIELAPTGRELAPGVVALALVALAGVLALVATRGLGRILVGVVVAVAGIGLAVLAATAKDETAALVQASAALGTTTPEITGVAGTPWPLITAAAGALVSTGGALIILRGSRWAGLGQRFETATGAPVPAEPGPQERHLWDAQNRGEDPTR